MKCLVCCQPNLHVIFLFVVDKDDEPIGDDISVRKCLICSVECVTAVDKTCIHYLVEFMFEYWLIIKLHLLSVLFFIWFVFFQSIKFNIVTCNLLTVIRGTFLLGKISCLTSLNANGMFGLTGNFPEQHCFSFHFLLNHSKWHQHL